MRACAEIPTIAAGDLNIVRLRKIGIAVVAVLALAGLSACDTKAGAAAVVGGERIDEADVTKYLTTNAVPYKNSSGTEVRPKSFVLQTLIRERMFTKALAEHGGPATSSELAGIKPGVLQGSTDEQVTSQITKTGYDASFEPLLIRATELVGLFAQRLGAQSDQDILTALDKLHLNVQVNPRYGRWTPAQLRLAERRGIKPLGCADDRPDE